MSRLSTLTPSHPRPSPTPFLPCVVLQEFFPLQEQRGTALAFVGRASRVTLSPACGHPPVQPRFPGNFPSLALLVPDSAATREVSGLVSALVGPTSPQPDPHERSKRGQSETKSAQSPNQGHPGGRLPCVHPRTCAELIQAGLGTHNRSPR